jgi:pimeloyl-ACP methyl ester carboxylesterase
LVDAAKGMRQFDSRPWLSALSARALVIAGAEDHAVPAHHFGVLTSQLRQVASRVIDGAGHTLVWTHTQVLAEIVRDWLREK